MSAPSQRRLLILPTRPWWITDGINAADVTAVYQPIGAPSYADSVINRASPGTYDGTSTATPSLVALGWSFNGSTQFINTGILPTATTTIVARYSNATFSQYHALFGCGDSNSAIIYIDLYSLNNGRFYNWGNGSASGGTPATSGVSCMAGSRTYFNGNIDATISGTWGNITSRTLWIGGMNLWYAAQPQFNGYVQAVAIYNIVLSAEQVWAVTTAMRAL